MSSQDDVELGSLVGETIDGRYRLDEVLGVGAMGAVYRAVQDVVDRSVAVKILHPDIVEDDPEFELRFEREAKALGKLDHPNLVSVFDFGLWEERDTAFMVTEFAAGAELSAVMPSHLGDVNFAIRVIREIALGLSHAHQRGVIHRDVKPSNVIWLNDDVEPHLKIVDFGLARLGQEEDDVRLTQSGDVFGTPAYMSPEQCQGDLELTPACDVYALGIIAFELFEGRLPFEAAKSSALLIKHVTAPIPSMGGLPPEGMRDIVEQMMSKDPEDRPTATDVVAACDAALSSMTDDETHVPAEAVEAARKPQEQIATAETLAATPTPIAPRMSTNVARYIMIAAALLVTLGGGWLIVRHSGEQEAQVRQVTETNADDRPETPPLPSEPATEDNAEEVPAIAEAMPDEDGGVAPATADTAEARSATTVDTDDEERLRPNGRPVKGAADEGRTRPVEEVSKNDGAKPAEETKETRAATPDEDAGHRTIELRY